MLRQIDVLAGMKTPSSVNVGVHLQPSLDLRDKVVGEKFFHLNLGNMATDTQGSEHLSHTTQLSRGCCSNTNLEQAPQAQTKKHGNNNKNTQLEVFHVHSLNVHRKNSNWMLPSPTKCTEQNETKERTIRKICDVQHRSVLVQHSQSSLDKQSKTWTKFKLDTSSPCNISWVKLRPSPLRRPIHRQCVTQLIF